MIDFVLKKALDATLENAADLFLGKKTTMSDREIEDTGAYYTGERSGGFLDFIKPLAKKGFDAYRDMTVAEQENRQSSRSPTFAETYAAVSQSSRFTPTPSGMSRGRGFTPSNPAFKQASLRRFNGQNFDSNFARMVAPYVLRQGITMGRRGKVSSVGSTNLRTKTTKTTIT